MGTDKRLSPWTPRACGVTAKDNPLCVDAVLYRYPGIPWRDLPERFGDFRVSTLALTVGTIVLVSLKSPPIH